MKLSNPHASQAGFALISSITIMALLVMITMGMLTLSVTERRNATHTVYQLEAQANAKVALIEAIGALQKYAGSDQRITAEASILEEPEPLSDKLANRHWVGVWRSDALKGEPAIGAQPLVYRDTTTSGPDAGSLMDRRADESYDAQSQTLAWLVSHLESANTLPDPSVDISNDDSVVLVGQNSTAEVEDYVRAQRIPISDDGKETGGYAWWVGDEGVKSRFDLTDASGGLALEQPWLTPAQSGINILDGYEDYEMVENSEIEKSTTRNTSDLSGSSAGDAKYARIKNFHDITFSSTGLLTNTLKGGLRQDLSAFFLHGSAPSLGDRKGLQPTDPILDSDKLKDLSAKFGLLHHWNELGKKITATSGVSPVAPENLANATSWGWNEQYKYPGSGINIAKQDTAPVHPIIIDAGISYGVSLTKVGDSNGTTTPYKLNIHYFPRVVLWNPYNVKINPAKYAVQINMPHKFNIQLRMAASEPINNQFFESWHGQYDGENLPHRPYFSIPATEFESGEALLFTADAGNASNGHKYWGDVNTAAAGDLNIFKLSCKKAPPFNDNFYIKSSRTIQIPDEKLSSLAYQVFAQENGSDVWGKWKHYFYKLYLDKGNGGNVTSIHNNPTSYPPLQFTFQGENGEFGSSGPWFDGIPSSASTPLRKLTQSPVTPFYRFKWGHRIQWINETNENQTITPGSYNTPYLGYNTIANHNMRAGWHVRSPIEVAHQTTSAGGRYVHGITIDDPYGWDWKDSNLFPVPVGGKNRVSPFGRPANFGGQTFPMLDLPSQETPLVSLGALQHAPLSQFAWHPMNAVGNSLADPRVKRNRSTNFVSAESWDTIGDGLTSFSEDKWKSSRQGHINSALDEASFLHDLSYETNHALWDNYFLSTVDGSYMPGRTLDNPRIITASETPKPPVSELRDFHKAAKHLMVKGAFNVNSTSESAWASLIASLRTESGMEITLEDGSKMQANDIYSRFLKPYQKRYTEQSFRDEETWTGHRQLNDDQIHELAKEIVREVKQRGPFISLSDFINRRLVDPPKSSNSETEFTKTGLKGTLQAALDRTSINSNQLTKHPIAKSEYKMSSSAEKQVEYGNDYPKLTFPVKNNEARFGPKPDHNHWADSKLVGAPSFLTQADLLQKFGSILSARSDTFVIRTYGESLDDNGKIKAKAWCEAIVQRTQTPMLAGPHDLDPEKDTDTYPLAAYGRRFKIVSFRWINHNEI